VSLDSFQQTTATFQGKVKNIEYHTTVRGDQYVLVYVRGMMKPLAVATSRTQEIPNEGDHVSVEANEGNEWFFPNHRATVIIKPSDWATWKKPSTIDQPRREQAEAIVMEYLNKNGSVCADDVSLPIQNLFPERNARIVGAIFLGLSKRGVIHKFGYRPTERKAHHGSDLAVWHKVLKK
jgi:hypothetical protein